MKVAWTVVVFALALASQSASTPEAAPRTLFRAKGPIRLAADPVEVRLAPAEGVRTLAAEVGALSAGEHIHLVLKGLRAESPPGVIYQVYMGSTLDPDAKARQERLLGYVNFFNVAQFKGSQAGELPGSVRSLDITDAVRKLRASLAEKTSVLVVPESAPEGGATPIIGEIEMVVSR